MGIKVRLTVEVDIEDLPGLCADRGLDAESEDFPEVLEEWMRNGLQSDMNAGAEGEFWLARVTSCKISARDRARFERLPREASARG